MSYLKAEGLTKKPDKAELSLISVVVLNWNGKRYLKDCLDSLRGQTFKEFEVIFVDNGSSDESVAYVKSNYKEVKVIALTENKGFGGGVNKGIENSKGELIFLLNNDTVVDPHCLEELNEAMTDKPSIGFCATKLLFYGEENVLNAAGDRFSRLGMGENIGYKDVDVGQYQTSKEVFGACAGAALFRASCLKEIGNVDEEFFFLYEDVDLDFRLQLYGYKCIYVPTAIVYHHYSGTAGASSHTTTYYTAKNDMNVLVKNMPASLFIKYLINIFIFQQRYARYSISVGHLLPFIKGEIKAFTELPLMLLKRYRILRGRKVTTAYIDSIFGEK